ncbi:MAG: hypothetical protein BEN19_02695 [Epulopiscium sp. Nuni2H_MBin003]|nr:MAG: hypothetical protein BEN19_02695 [Epulopiscium sp. Nuni2H_MBin003]
MLHTIKLDNKGNVLSLVVMLSSVFSIIMTYIFVIDYNNVLSLNRNDETNIILLQQQLIAKTIARELNIMIENLEIDIYEDVEIETQIMEAIRNELDKQIYASNGSYRYFTTYNFYIEDKLYEYEIYVILNSQDNPNEFVKVYLNEINQSGVKKFIGLNLGGLDVIEYTIGESLKNPARLY